MRRLSRSLLEGETLPFLRDWIDQYDSRIAAWVRRLDAGENPERLALGFDVVRDMWRTTGAIARDDGPLRALPEPWVGDPFSPDLQAVFVCHNPGAALPAQMHPHGALVERIRSGMAYSQLAGRWALAPETRRWWSRLAGWAARLLGVPPVRRAFPILGIDLLPWHSELRAPFRPDRRGCEFLRRWVFLPAREAAKRSRLRLRLSENVEAPAAIANHGWVDAVLEALGAEELTRIDHERHGERIAAWPRNLSDKPVRRTFVLRRLPLPRGDLHLLVSWAPGSNLPPAAAFDPLTRWLLRSWWRDREPPATIGA